MNLKKIFTTLILSVAALVTFACQYSLDGVGGGGGGSSIINKPLDHRRFFYLSGINAPGNHINGVTYEVSSSENWLIWSAANFVEVSLPLTVYVGVADINCITWRSSPQNFKFGEEMEEITITAQYRVMPEATWHTAAVKKFAVGNVSLLSKQKIFGPMQIDCEASPGSTVLVRLYITVNTLFDSCPVYGGSYSDGTTYEMVSFEGIPLDRDNPIKYIENADPESLSVDSLNEIHAVEQHRTPVMEWAGNTPSLERLNMEGRIQAGEELLPDYFLRPRYQDGWTPQFLMAVTIGNKRRPGK